MLQALAHWREYPAVSVYQAIFFHQNIKFQYPISALLVLDAPRSFFQLSDAGVTTLMQVLSRLTVPAFAALFALLLVGAVREEERYASPGSLAPTTWAMLGATGLVSVALFYPLTRSEILGQVQTLLSLGAALALWAWQTERTRCAGSSSGSAARSSPIGASSFCGQSSATNGVLPRGRRAPWACC